MGDEWPLFIATTQFRAAHESGNKHEIDRTFGKLLEAQDKSGDYSALRGRITDFWLAPGWSSNTAPVNLPPAFSDAMSGARLVLWWNSRKKQFLPAIFCPDYRTAMFVRAAMKDLRACPDCDKPFIQERADQEYCSTRCGTRHRVRRMREKRRSRKK